MGDSRTSLRSHFACDQRLAVRQRLRNLGEFRHGGEQRLEVSKQVADQAVGHVALQIADNA